MFTVSQGSCETYIVADFRLIDKVSRHRECSSRPMAAQSVSSGVGRLGTHDLIQTWVLNVSPISSLLEDGTPVI